MQTGQSDNGAVSRVAMIPVEFEIFDPSLDVYRENIEAINLFQFIGEFLNGNRYGELVFFTLMPISQIEIELRAMRSASEITCAAVRDRRSRFSVQNTRAEVSKTITPALPIRQWSAY